MRGPTSRGSCGLASSLPGGVGTGIDGPVSTAVSSFEESDGMPGEENQINPLLGFYVHTQHHTGALVRAV